MKYSNLWPLCLLLGGCAQAPNYQFAHATQQIKEMQILDPDAPVNNDGVTRELQGDYGKRAADSYRNSIYVSKEGRNVEAAEGGGGNNR